MVTEEMEQNSESSKHQSLKLTRTLSSNSTLMNREKMSSANFRPKSLSKFKPSLSDSALPQTYMTTRSTRAGKMDNFVSKASQERMRRLSAIEMATIRNIGKPDQSSAAENKGDKNHRAALISGGTGLQRSKRSSSLKTANNAIDKGKLGEQKKLPFLLNSWTGVQDGEASGNVDNRLTAIGERKNSIDNYLKNSKSRATSQSHNTDTPKNNKDVSTNSIVGNNNEKETSGNSTEPEREKVVPKLALEKLDEDDSDNVRESTTKSRGWSLLKKKLQEVREQPIAAESTTADSGKATSEEQSTASYLRMLRERLRSCQPADIIASSDVNEIAKRKQDLQRRKSVNGMMGKKSFFETVLTAHALAKQNKMTSRSTESSRKSSRSYPPSLSSQSLPDISSTKMKFKCSPHFHKTLRQMGKNHFLIQEEDTDSSQDTSHSLISRFSM